MHSLLHSFGQCSSIRKIIKQYGDVGRRTLVVNGLSGSARTVLAAAFAAGQAAPMLLTTASRETLELYRHDLSVLCPDRAILELPISDSASVHAMARSQELARQEPSGLMDWVMAVLPFQQVAVSVFQKGCSFRVRR